MLSILVACSDPACAEETEILVAAIDQVDDSLCGCGYGYVVLAVAELELV